MEGERGREREILKNKKTQRETKEIKNEMRSYYNKSLLMTYTQGWGKVLWYLYLNTFYYNEEYLYLYLGFTMYLYF